MDNTMDMDRQTREILQKYPVDSSTKLGREDLLFVRGAMINIKQHWYNIGVEFEVDINILGEIERDNRDVDACFTSTIAEWLNNGKCRNRRAIIVAIASTSGGNNPGEAEKVAKAFQGSKDNVYQCNVPEAEHVDDHELEQTAANYRQIIQALTPVEHEWKNIGIFLGLDYYALSEGQRSSQQLQTVVKKWLSKTHNVGKFGPPSWKKLVEAVGSKVGANDSAHALSIAEGHAANGTLTRMEASTTSILVDGVPNQIGEQQLQSGVLTSGSTDQEQKANLY